MEMEKVPQAGYKIIGLDIAGFNRSSLIKNIGLPFKMIKSFFQARKIMSEFKPDAVIGVGGYASFPMLQLAQAKKYSNLYSGVKFVCRKIKYDTGKKSNRRFLSRMKEWKNFFQKKRS